MIRLYYWLTPAFALLDWLAGWNLRISGLDATGPRLAYYAFLLACFALITWRPGLTAPVAIIESSVNFFLLVSAVMLPIYGLAYIDDPATMAVLTWPRLVNFLLTGFVLIYVFQRNVSRLRR